MKTIIKYCVISLIAVVFLFGITNIIQKKVRMMEDLTSAVRFNDTAKLKLLLDKGADVNIQLVGNVTLLMEASYAGNPEVVKLLLKKGADVNATNKCGDTAYFIAYKKGHTEVVRLLKAHGAK